MKKEMQEVWRKIPGYKGYYEASNMGRIKSIDRTVVFKDGREQFFKGRILESSINNGYRRVRLSVNGEGRTLKVSQLVAMAFLGYKPDGHNVVVDHVNGIRSDDRVENLRVVSSRENVSTCFRKDRKILTSKYTGVQWHKSNSKWRSYVRVNGTQIHLGYFNDELKASEAYQKALFEINNGVFNR